MFKSGKELWLAFGTCILLGAGYTYITYTTNEIYPPGEFTGHVIGICGFIFMLSSETLYSLRKRSRDARWGKMSTWLKFHIYTGIVGPFMVLLHSSWKFNGIAGISMLLTIIIVVSGFIGRYIYTRIPRTADGIEDQGLIGQIQTSALIRARKLLSIWHTIHIPIGITLFLTALIHVLGSLYFSTLLK